MLSRRHLLQVGALGLAGAAPAWLRGGSPKANPKAKAKAVIFLHQWGGPSHHDTFDMKPAAPAEVRGEYKPIPSRLPGLPVCELLPRCAQVMDRVCLVRTLRHTMKNHNSAGYYSLTGYAPPTDDQRLRDSRDLFPAYGSVVDRLSPARQGIPTFVAFPHVISDGSVTPGQHASFLGKSHDPLLITQDPNADDFRLPELSLPAGLSPGRLADRREMMKLIDEQSELLEISAKAKGIAEHYDRALSMLQSPGVKAAFDLSREPACVRERYGRTTYGQACLLARRLVEAGARFVNVYFAPFIGGDTGGWDTHGFNDKPMYPILTKFLLPMLDRTLPTLIEDLDQRGLLDSTLVVWVGEFGRTPRINKLAGRDHWPQCYPAILAGGGVKRGHVFGSSDKLGAYPATDPVRPEDLSATMFHLLGLDPATEVSDALNRPLPVSPGQVIEGVLE
ncbi:MAG: DUF1501 domain-containing protein [Gemmataceae bacterium]